MTSARRKSIPVLPAWLLLLAFLPGAALASDKGRPNILFVIVDDQSPLRSQGLQSEIVVADAEHRSLGRRGNGV